MKKTRLMLFMAFLLFSAAMLFLPYANGKAFFYLQGGALTVGRQGQSGASASVVTEADTGWFAPDAAVYYIDAYSKLKGFAFLVGEGITFKGKTVNLLNDISLRVDFSIGGAGRSFEGVFDGGGNLINVGAPLFDTLKSAEIKNLFIDAMIVGGMTQDVGIVANAAYDSVISRVAVKLTYGNDGNYGNFGGITAYAKNTLIKSCAVTGEIIRQGAIVGGGIAAIAEDSRIVDCYNGANITVSYISEYIIGGIVGKAAATELDGCVNYSPIVLRPFLNFEYAVDGVAGAIAGEIDFASAVIGASCLKSELTGGLPPVGKQDAETVSVESYTSAMLKDSYFLNNVLNKSPENRQYTADIVGYEVNGGYPIFVYQIPRPSVGLEITGLGSVLVDGAAVFKGFKVSLGAELNIELRADTYYVIESVEVGGLAVEITDANKITFTTDGIYENIDIRARFAKEMRTIELDGVSASKVYDGSTAAPVSALSTGAKGLFVVNVYFAGDDIRITNGFDGPDPIRARFLYADAGVSGQCIVLENVKFGGASVVNYALPDSFKIYKAEIFKAELRVYYGGIDKETQSYTPGAAASVYGDEITDGKYYGFSVDDDNFMLSGEFFVEIFDGGQYRPLSTGELLAAGRYKLRAAGVSALNYNITFEECVLTVEARRLFVSYAVKGGTVIYGSQPEFVFEYQNFVDGEDESVLKSLPYFDGGVLTYGRHELTLKGGEADNYIIVNVKGAIDVAKKAIALAAETDKFKIYGDDEPVWYGISDGLCYSDYAVFVRSNGKDAGQYGYSSYNIFDLNKKDVGFCYEVTETNPNAVFNIKKRALTIKAKDAETTYGRIPEIGFLFENLTAGDSVSPISVYIYAESDTGFDNPLGLKLDAGRYLVKPDYSQSHKNYDITYAAGLLTVKKAALTLTVKNLTVTYGDAVSPEYSISGFKNNEDKISAGINFEAVRLYIDGRSVERPDAGGYALTVDGCEAKNYRFEYAAGVLTVVKAELTVAIRNPQTVTYGGDISFEYEFFGFISGDDAQNQLVNLRVSYRFTTDLQTVTPTAEARNYNLTYIGNTLKIDKKILTLSGISVLDKLYDGTKTAAVTGEPTLVGVVGGDAISLVGTLTAQFDRVGAGIKIPVTISGLSIEGQRADMYELVIEKLYAGISINTVFAGGIRLVASGLLPSDSLLNAVETADYAALKRDIGKNVGGRKIYYAVELSILTESPTVNAGGTYTVYIPAELAGGASGLKAVIIKDGKYTEVKTRYENGYIVFECESLGSVALVANNNWLLIFLLIICAITVAAVLYFIFFNDKVKGVLRERRQKKLSGGASGENGGGANLSACNKGGEEQKSPPKTAADADDEVYEEIIRETIGGEGDMAADADGADIIAADIAAGDPTATASPAEEKKNDKPPLYDIGEEEYLSMIEDMEE
ncbi:MAG: YDG domain-containing protein [Clostridiales bacterium]|jgi:hypothetical protein|nr:YDG domain-containing protein [Clostridiales bacterium]